MMKGDTALGQKPVSASTKTAKALAPRDLAQTQNLFADALKRADARPAPLRKKTLDDQTVSGSIMTPTSYATTAPTAPPAAPSAPDPAIAAHIERIAAAIAEVSGNGAQAEVHLQLPPGATRIDGAVLGRNDVGQMHIALITTSAITPSAAAQLQSQLSERLLRRDIRVARMTLQRVRGAG